MEKAKAVILSLSKNYAVFSTSPHLQQRQQNHLNHKTNQRKIYICKIIVRLAGRTI